MDNRILEKIKKCLALSKSSNEHEAQVALRQAQKLMEAYNLTSIDVEASSVTESETKTGAIARPSGWEGNLVRVICKAFGCESIHRKKARRSPKTGKLGFVAFWVFIGVGSAPELASYTLSVLMRQLKKSRKAFIEKLSQSYTTQAKTRKADVFCLAWVEGINQKVVDFATPASRSAIDAYKNTHFDQLKTLSTTNRVKHLSRSDSYAINEGLAASDGVQLHRAMNQNDVARLQS